MLSNQGRDILIEREGGLILKAYRDSEGYWTIGGGHLLSLDKNADFSSLVWSYEHAEEVFVQDITKYERAIDHVLRVPITQAQRDALISFGHNIGEAGVMNSEVIKQINAGDLEAAAEAFDNWHTPTSIISRRNAEKAQFMGLPPVARLDTDPVHGTVSSMMLHRGMRGDAVVDLQRKLLILADGDYGPATEAAVKNFQRDHGLYPDGVAGPKTMAVLNA